MTDETGGGSSTAVSTIEHGGMTLTSVGVSEKDIKASLASTEDGDAKPEKEGKAKPSKPNVSDAARELGKRGGKAAAERRAEAAKEATEGEAGQQRTTKQADGDEEGEQEVPDEKLGDRARKRIEIATRKQAEARRDLERERQERQQERARHEAELAALRVRQGGPQGEAEGNRPGESPRTRPDRDPSSRPREADFETWDQYLDARDKWNREETIREWTQQEERRHHAVSAVETVKNHVDTFLKHVTPELKDEIDPEILEMKPVHMMGDGDQYTPDNFIATEAVYARELGPPVLKYLTDHPEELQRLRALRTATEVQIEMRAIVRYLAKTLGSKPDAIAGDPPGNGDGAPKRQLSKANPPVRPVTGAPHIADGDAGPRENEDFDAWVRRESKRTAPQR